MNHLLNIILLCSLVLLLTACQTETGQVTYSGNPVPVASETQEAETEVISERFVQARILADMLYEARMAFEDNRLLIPAGDNAYDRYMEVLSFDPENAVALQGIQDIVVRYIDLAGNSIRTGQYDEAGLYIARAARIDPDSAILAPARAKLAEARKNPVQYRPLDIEALSEQSLEVMAELAEIGEYIQSQEATFLINARTDDEGRWIYRIMREAVGGYRLRGNIELSPEPAILITVPDV